jgi:WD40 repeat protein
MSSSQLRDAIDKRLALAASHAEPGLIDSLLADVGAEPGNLALLEHALGVLWKKCGGQGCTLTGQAYADIGRLRGALAKHADEVYNEIDDSQKRLIQRIFLELVQLGEGAPDTRRRVPKQALLQLGESGQVELLLARLASSRLTSTGGQELDSQHGAFVEVSHEALIREWTTLREWVKNNRADLRLERRFTQAAEEWEGLKKDPSALLRGARLAQAEEWLQKHSDAPAPLLEFLTASRTAREEELRKEREAQQLELARARRELARARWLATFAAASAIIAVFAAGATYYALQEAIKAAANRLAADARSQITPQPELGVLLALHAVRRNSGKVTREALEYAAQAARRPLVELAVSGDPPEVKSFAYSGDGAWMASAHADDLVRLWEVDTGKKMPLELKHPDRVLTVAASPNGELVATGCADGVVRIWKVQGEKPVAELPSTNDPVRAVDFNQDGTLLAAAYFNTHRVTIWQTASFQKQGEYIGEAPAMSVRFRPPGNSLAVGYNDGSVLLWNPDAKQSHAVLTKEAQNGQIRDLRFNAQGSALAVASDKAAFLCDLSGKLPREVGRDDSGFAAVAFSPGGRHLAVASRSGTFIVLDAATLEEFVRVGFDGSPLTSAAFQPKLKEDTSEKLAVGAVNGTVRVYELNLNALRAFARERVHEAKVSLTPEQCTQYLEGKDCSVVP